MAIIHYWKLGTDMREDALETIPHHTIIGSPISERIIKNNDVALGLMVYTSIPFNTKLASTIRVQEDGNEGKPEFDIILKVNHSPHKP